MGCLARRSQADHRYGQCCDNSSHDRSLPPRDFTQPSTVNHLPPSAHPSICHRTPKMPAPELAKSRRRTLLRLRRTLPELPIDDVYVSDFSPSSEST